MPPTARFLLIEGTSDEHWHTVFEKALNPLGELYTGTEDEAVQLVHSSAYDIIFLDASAINDLVALVTQLRHLLATTPIIVLTASPTWNLARDLFRAGATDYLRKSLNQEAVRTIAATVLRRG
ncbi:MAG TPA: response regulator [Caldilineaceae bacterium]|nr:response regulator [Caldilineaceae bacterium]